MSGGGWGSLVAPVDAEESPLSCSNGGASSTAMLSDNNAPTGVTASHPASGWGSLVASTPNTSTSNLFSPEFAEADEDEVFDIADFAAPSSRKRGRPSAALAALPPLQTRPVAWYHSNRSDAVTPEQGSADASSFCSYLTGLGIEPGQGLQLSDFLPFVPLDWPAALL